MNDLKTTVLRAEPCPCGHPGCRKFIVRPLFNSVDAGLYKEEADELVRHWNSFTEVEPVYEEVVRRTKELMEKRMKKGRLIKFEAAVKILFEKDPELLRRYIDLPESRR